MKASERPFETEQTKQNQNPESEPKRRLPFRGRNKSDGKQQNGAFKKLPNLLQLGLVSGGLLIGITILGAIATLLSNEPQPIGESVTLENLVGAPSTGTTQTEQVPDENQREMLWKQVGIARANLDTELEAIDSELRLARAQKWITHAQAQCDRLGSAECPSYYGWLTVQYAVWKNKLQNLTTDIQTTDAGDGQQISISRQLLKTDANSAQEYRQTKQTLLDIAAALSLSPAGVTPRPFVDTQGLHRATEDYQTTVTNFGLPSDGSNQPQETSGGEE
jgi:hypothetical protein